MHQETITINQGDFDGSKNYIEKKSVERQGSICSLWLHIMGNKYDYHCILDFLYYVIVVRLSGSNYYSQTVNDCQGLVGRLE